MIDKRYIRNLNALSIDDCALISTKKILIAGCGGLGCYVIESLSRLGVGTIASIDFDTFAKSNLNRQLYCTEDNLGQYKVDVAKKRIAHINSDIKFIPIKEKITKDNCIELTKNYDLIVDCLDSFESRFWLSVGANKNNTAIIFGSIAGWFGQVCSVFPGDISYSDIYGCMEDKTSLTKSEGNLGTCAGVVANIQASQALSIMLDGPGVLRNKILMIDLLNSSFEIMSLG